MIFLPPLPLRKTRKCERCGLRTPKSENSCHHCAAIPDGKALDDFIQEWNDGHEGNRRLGLIFLIISLALLGVITIAAL